MSNYNEVRIFNIEGLELFDEDFEFLKSGETMFTSCGEDFDHATYVSEYDISKTLGQGGFGDVVLGTHKETKELVAIKVTKANAIDNADDIDTVFAEAETLKMLDHEGIVKIYKNFIIKKTMQAYFIMEYLEGGELLEYVLEKKFLLEEEAKGYIIQVIDAIDYCHRQKIIHRDLKLENVLKVTTTGHKIKV
jgi:serine/threonine protein kinase